MGQDSVAPSRCTGAAYDRLLPADWGNHQSKHCGWSWQSGMAEPIWSIEAALLSDVVHLDESGRALSGIGNGSSRPIESHSVSEALHA
jgi:hypothetical protein